MVCHKTIEKGMIVIATAEVSGIVALLLELKPDLTFAEARSILQKSEPG